MRIGVIAMTAEVLFVGGASQVAAQQWVQTTASDSVLIDGGMYPRVSFSVHNWHPSWGFYLVTAGRLSATSPADTCRAIRAVAPPGWVAELDLLDGVVLWQCTSGYVGPGVSVSGFQLVLTAGHSACFAFGFEGAVQAAGGETDCFGGPDQPVPVARQTWGALKARYR